MSQQVIEGDNLATLKTYPDNYFDAVVTDPPYGLSFMGKKWDYDVPRVELWAEVFRVLKPGGHLLAFAGTRTQHRMAVNIEDAGFEIRDLIAWVYGSGTTGVACKLEGFNYVGLEFDPEYCKISRARIQNYRWEPAPEPEPVAPNQLNLFDETL